MTVHELPDRREVDVVVIGAGQAGLSAAYYLKRRGFVPVEDAGSDERTFVVIDGEDGPGGAWRHRFDALTVTIMSFHR